MINVRDPSASSVSNVVTSTTYWQTQTTALSKAAATSDPRFAVMFDNSIIRLSGQKILVEAVTASFLVALVDIRGLQSSLFTGFKEHGERISTLVLESAAVVGIMHSDLRRASLFAQKDPNLMHGALICTFADLITSLSSLFARGEQLSDWSSTTEAMADAGTGPSYRITRELIAALRAH